MIATIRDECNIYVTGSSSPSELKACVCLDDICPTMLHFFEEGDILIKSLDMKNSKLLAI